ncbi:hypothetical protein TSOC_005455 [Tetrabaena socialis]|uniref:Uncharacterized protein n=1 Tax=Tetrabaena socialis TaxID=47790 RepID=A0A2J8A684_9CHLO|nr:hypothetical protein TSOC_005455 [Tetrabaena socialis]|eukprot:PNH08010.1 hypothetical protein TSOC_005455 [Tetrabaena socialis]
MTTRLGPASADPSCHVADGRGTSLSGALHEEQLAEVHHVAQARALHAARAVCLHPALFACLALGLLHVFLWALQVPHLGGAALRVSWNHDPCATTATLAAALDLEPEGFICFVPANAVNQSVFATLMTVHTQAPRPLVRLLRINRLLYARRQGYRYCEANMQIDPTRGPSWNKMAVAAALLPFAGSYLLVMDSDAVVVNMEVRVEDLVAAHDPSRAAALILSKEYPRPGPPSHINAGVFLAAQSPRTLELLQGVYNRFVGRHNHQEQQGLNRYLDSLNRTSSRNRPARHRRLMALDSSRAGDLGQQSKPELGLGRAADASQVLIVDYTAFNMHGNFYTGQPGSAFVVHWAGMPANKKMPLMQQALARQQGANNTVTQRLTGNDAYCLDQLSFHWLHRSTVWFLVRWVADRWQQSYKMFYGLGVWSQISVTMGSAVTLGSPRANYTWAVSF